MKTLLFLSIITSLFAKQEAIQGIERVLMQEKREACIQARAQAKEKYNIVEINAGCTCEKSDDRRWNCFVLFTHIPKEK
ncbi:MAG: hypothetical protein RBR54_04490 [Sulfurimonas sp.]|jgi:hypothetical protein|nr:hypothetical protein [Sulfurimonas sp.]